MSTGIIIAIVVVVVLLIAVGVAVATIGKRKRESKKLEQRFGPEYDRALEQHGDRKEAEQSLKQREERHEGLDIRPLAPEQQQHFAGEWRNVQARFVDAPQEAVRESDHLVREVMRQRGYPVDDFNQRADDISVSHPNVVENYRSAGAIAERNERGEASTEDLRQATVHYRALFEELLDTSVTNRGSDGTDGGHGEQSAGQGNDAGAGGRRGEEVR
ncbi:MAG: putative secreted protein [uncultured Solirubrobacterales bacterium]|uniref:Putative secreted protein n=1 Tax=uncultured Solirubrobacterales bacterium TaxID=768556 RepID=A0A6J4SY68_9ACTN|nr:MAG: putative secreted protein [uncultured Solirubrobacterales bacterium]